MIFVHAFAGAILGKYIVKERQKVSQITQPTKITKKDVSIIYFLAIVGSIFPDFDLLTLLLDRTIHHRYLISHSFTFYTILLLLLLPFKKWINFTYALSFYIGVVFGHFALDMVTGGIAFFAPFSNIIVGFPMPFRNLVKAAYISAYLKSNYMLAELGILAWYIFFVYKKEKDVIAKKLPVFFSVVSFIVLALVTVL
jgi:hypothetical protein